MSLLNGHETNQSRPDREQGKKRVLEAERISQLMTASGNHSSSSDFPDHGDTLDGSTHKRTILGT